MSGAEAHRLPGGRLRLVHGPIDLILAVEGPGAAAAEARAWARFAGLLDELVAELPALRRPVAAGAACPLQGPVARRMWAATAPFAPVFVTPMAAVAGAVAEAVLAAAADGDGIFRAYANNGGDIALHLPPGAEPWRLAVAVDPLRPASPGVLRIGPCDACRGVATSGRHGRSLSLGIADSVTVLAACAPGADAAATLIANAVDLPGDPSVARAPARRLQPDSDLGALPVTVAVGPLTPAQVGRALDRGAAAAAAMLDRGLILGAVLVLAGEVRLLGAAELRPAAAALARPSPPTGAPIHA